MAKDEEDVEEAGSSDATGTRAPDGTTRSVETGKDDTFVDLSDTCVLASATFSSSAEKEGGRDGSTVASSAAADASSDTVAGGVTITAGSLEVIVVVTDTAAWVVSPNGSILKAGNMGEAEDGTQMLIGDTVSTRYTGCRATNRSG
jgi:hypothetical protein